MFAGGWTLEAASEVCSGESIAKDDVVYVLIRLIEQSLVVADEDGDRYRMLETVREYAQERLEKPAIGDAVRERWRDRHLAYFLALAEEAEPKLNGTQQRDWLERLEREHDNLRSALAWAAASADAVSGMRLASACWRFWLIRGYAREGLGWLSAMLAAAPDVQPTRTEARAKALNGAGTLARNLGDYGAAQAMFEESLAIWRTLDRRRGIAQCAERFGAVGVFPGRLSNRTHVTRGKSRDPPRPR